VNNIEEYLRLHKMTRLGISADEKKKALIKDERLEKLRKLANIQLLPRTQLNDFISVFLK